MEEIIVRIPARHKGLGPRASRCAAAVAGSHSSSTAPERSVPAPRTAKRARNVSFDRRRRIEYECSAERDGEIDEDGDGVIDR